MSPQPHSASGIYSSPSNSPSCQKQPGGERKKGEKREEEVEEESDE
jgi:hypothetical protein